MNVSNETKSKAYQFMKALLKDGADGEQINTLVNDIGEHLDKDIAGQILLDLLQNPEDVHADVKHHSHWFGPVNFSWYYAVAKAWTEFCDAHEIRGHMTFGDLKHWEKWRKVGNYNINDAELKELNDNSRRMILVFNWWSDDIVNKEAMKTIDTLYKATEKNNEKD